MKKIKFYFYLIAALSSFGCQTEEIFIEAEPATSKLVIASQIIPGDFMFVAVTHSFSALVGNEDSISTDFLGQILVEDAEVSLTFNGQTVSLEPIEDIAGVYISAVQLDSTVKEIQLEVFDPKTADRVSAVTNILPRITPDSVRLTEEVISGDTIQTLYFSFIDPPEDNWYVVNAFDPGGFVDDISSNPFSLFQNNIGIAYDRLLTDQTFDKARFERSVKLESRIQSDTIALFFSNISEGYFRFLDARQRTGGIISSATSEPINHPTNVQGGLGYFNAHNPSILLVGKERI